jgi:hypothetical protein
MELAFTGKFPWSQEYEMKTTWNYLLFKKINKINAETQREKKNNRNVSRMLKA